MLVSKEVPHTPADETARRFAGAAWLCVLVSMIPGLWRTFGEEPHLVRSTVAATTHHAPFRESTQEPGSLDSRLMTHVCGNMSAPTAIRLLRALTLAEERIKDVEECRELFSALGADGIELLERTEYSPARDRAFNTSVCNRSDAYTHMGGGPVWLCRSFARLPTRNAATTLIHEALHHAGLTEKPHDPQAMTSFEISAMVKEKCRLNDLTRPTLVTDERKPHRTARRGEP